jgi:hypothetical protein
MRLICLLFLIALSASGQDTDASKEKGILSLTSALGASPVNIRFSQIQWTSYSGGTVTDLSKVTTTFDNREIGKIIYFDGQYYNDLDRDNRYTNWRLGIQGRETVINAEFSKVVTADDFQALTKMRNDLQTVINDSNATIRTSLEPKKAIIDDAITKYTNNQRFENGKWMSLQEYAALKHEYGPVSFTLKDGTNWNKVYITITDDPNSIEVRDTIDSPSLLIPLADLADDSDISSFPSQIADRIFTAKLDRLKSNDAGISEFFSQAKILYKQLQGKDALQKQLSKIVIDKSVDSITRYGQENDKSVDSITSNGKEIVIWREWPKLQQAISFDSTQQIYFYKTLLEKGNLPYNQCKEVLALASSSDWPAESKALIQNWSDQIKLADKLNGQMEINVTAFFADPVNKPILGSSVGPEELAKPLNFQSNGDALLKSIKDQMPSITIQRVQNELAQSQLCWVLLQAISSMRKQLSEGNLKDAAIWYTTLNGAITDDIGRLPADQKSAGLKLVEQAVVANVAIYNSQKQTAQKLFDEAERLKVMGGQNAKALQDYKDAYKLNSDPAILERIKDLNKESLGI